MNIGFFILEVSVALLVLILVVVLAWPFLWFHDQINIKQDVQKLYTAILYQQQKAKSSFETHYLTFDLTKKSFKYNNQIYELSSNTDYGVAQGIKGPPSAPKKDIINPITFEGKRIAFYPDGTISAGIVYLYDRKTKESYAVTSSVSYISFIRKYIYTTEAGWKLID